MHSTAAVTIGGSPSANVNVNHNLYQPSQHQTQYGQVTQQHPHISSPTQQIQQPQSHLHHQHPNHNHHQLVCWFNLQYEYFLLALLLLEFKMYINFDVQFAVHVIWYSMFRYKYLVDFRIKYIWTNRSVLSNFRPQMLPWWKNYLPL